MKLSERGVGEVLEFTCSSKFKTVMVRKFASTMIDHTISYHYVGVMPIEISI